MKKIEAKEQIDYSKKIEDNKEYTVADRKEYFDRMKNDSTFQAFMKYLVEDRKFNQLKIALVLTGMLKIKFFEEDVEKIKEYEREFEEQKND